MEEGDGIPRGCGPPFRVRAPFSLDPPARPRLAWGHGNDDRAPRVLEPEQSESPQRGGTGVARLEQTGNNETGRWAGLFFAPRVGAGKEECYVA